MLILPAAIFAALSLPRINAHPVADTLTTAAISGNVTEVGAVSTVFEDIIAARVDALEQAYGPISLQQVIARDTGAPQHSTSDPEGFTHIVITYIVTRTRTGFWTERRGPASEGFRWTTPKSNPGTVDEPIWSWGDRTSTLAQQLGYLRENGFDENYLGFMLWKVPADPNQLYWSFHRALELRGQMSYDQGDRDHRLIDLRTMRYPGGVGMAAFNGSLGIADDGVVQTA